MPFAMQLFKICNIALFYCIMFPYRPVLTHLTYYVNNQNYRNLASLKISKRYNDELIHKARMCYFEYSHSRPNSMERKYIYKELETLRDKIRKLYIYYKKLIEREVKYNSQELISFDVAMYQLSCTLSGRKHFNNRNSPDHQLIDCPIISNYSLEEDISTSVNQVKKDHPQTIILHKKTQALFTNFNQAKTVPVFLHIPKNGGTYIVAINQKLLEQNLHKFSKTKLLAQHFIVTIALTPVVMTFVIGVLLSMRNMISKTQSISQNFS